MAYTGLRIASAVSIFVVLCSIYFRPTDRTLNRLSDVLAGLQKAEEQSHYIGDSKRIVIGYGACKDVFSSAADLFDFAESSEEPGEIHTLKDLQESFTYFFKHGAAAERYISNGTVFNELVNAALDKNARYALGGNAPVMAVRFAEAGFNVLLAAKMTPALEKDLPNKITVIGPSSDEDDVHLILEYKTGDKWGPYTAPRANRFIVHNDDNNPTISSAEKALEQFRKYKPKLLVVGGLQMMDNFNFAPGVRKSRLAVIQKQMRDMEDHVHIHFEMASFSQSTLIQDLIDDVIPYADSLGMNEQELANLLSMLKYGNVTTVADSNPRVAKVLDDMRRVFSEITKRSSKNPDHRQLTRIHIHTLAYQTIMTVQDSSWPATAQATAKASLTANRHVCNSHEVDIEKARLIMDNSFAASRANGSRRIEVDDTQPISCWEEPSPAGLVQICVAPNLVCTQATQTCGGGDNISASALGVQI